MSVNPSPSNLAIILSKSANEFASTSKAVLCCDNTNEFKLVEFREVTALLTVEINLIDLDRYSVSSSGI